jgi:hypothetical protein
MKKPSGGRGFLWIPWKPAWKRPDADHPHEEGLIQKADILPSWEKWRPGKSREEVGPGDYYFKSVGNAVQDVSWLRPFIGAPGEKFDKEDGSVKENRKGS